MKALSIIAALFLATAGIACGVDTDTTNDSGVDQGLGAEEASGDVNLGACKVNFGVVTCELTIVNSSDGRSDYYIEATLETHLGQR
jgi:hypothetical protein